MAKKQKRKKAGRKKPPLIWFVGAVVLVVLVAVISGNIPLVNSEGKGKKTRSFLVKGGETRPVLDPANFTGMARAAYAAAKSYPEVMDQVYCYCRCDQPPFYHKSLLSCFTENHAAG